MKHKLLLFIVVVLQLCYPAAMFGQAPDLGVASGFAIFTAAGALNNSGTTSIAGDIGSNTVAATGFPPGVVAGSIYNPPNAKLAQSATDVGAAYGYLSTLGGAVIGVGLGNGQIINPGIYQTGAASTLNGNLTLDAQGDANAVFIIRIGGAFATGVNSNVVLINGASYCNVYWQIGGEFDLGDYSVFKGNVIVDGAINLMEGCSVWGRILSKAGAISIYNCNVRFLPSVADAITGSHTVCAGQTGVSYTVATIAGATSYVWTLPSGASIVTGTNTNSIIVDFGIAASSGNITVDGINACGNGMVSPNYTLTIALLPLTSSIYHE